MAAAEGKDDGKAKGVDVCMELGAIPQAGFVGRYGGGEEMAAARQIVLVDVPSDRIPKSLQERVLAASKKAHAAAMAVPAGERIAKVPGALPKDDDWKWKLRFQVSSMPPGGRTGNWMCQGWLFLHVFAEPGRLGASKWPLCGLFDSLGLVPCGSAGPGVGDVSPAIGLDALNPSDQHVHLVEGIEAWMTSWNMGSDMARFTMEDGWPVGKAWAVCADIESSTVEVTLLMVASPGAEAPAETAAGASGSGVDTKTLHTLLTDGTPYAMFSDEIAQVLGVKAGKDDEKPSEPKEDKK